MVPRDLESAALYLADTGRIFRQYKSLADRALDQVDDQAFFALPDEESNSLAILVKHMAGNLHSRWTDFLTSDGEKPDRNRDGEFVIEAQDSRGSLMQAWEAGWALLFDQLDGLTGPQLMETVTIRGQPHRVLEAINRQVAHYSYHVGQIVFLAKAWKGRTWQTLSIPRGQSAQFNRRMQEEGPDGVHRRSDP